MIKAIIFDFDGVLVESVGIKTSAFAKLFKQEDSRALREIIEYHENNAGVSRFDKFRYIYKEILHRELAEEHFKRLCLDFATLVIDNVVNAPYVAGAKEFLDEHGTKYAMYIASATPQSEIEEIVDRRGMRSYFTGVFGAPRKKAEVVSDVVAAGDFSRHELVFIGDAKSDYDAATACGIRFILRETATATGIVDKKIVCVSDLTGLPGLILNFDD